MAINYNDSDFPQEESEGAIIIRGDKIIYDGERYYLGGEINITDIQYAYVIVDRHGKSSLFLFDHHQHYLSTSLKGFKETYLRLSERFGFNDRVFFECLDKTERSKEEIWRRKVVQNYEVKNRGKNDYHKGFEILAPNKEFISWDIPQNQLIVNENVYTGTSPYNQRILKFKYPVRIGNIILNDLSAYIGDGRDDMPVMRFYTHCFDSTNTDASYSALKRAMKTKISEKDYLFGYEREDQKRFSFNAVGMEISLVYTYDSDWQFNGGYTSFSVENKREYPEFLIDEEYETNLEITEVIVLKDPAHITGDYKRNKNVKRRPSGLDDKSLNHSLIWLDSKNDKIGFADQKYSQVFDIAEIKSFAIQNILPAKGPGGAYFEICFANKERSLAVLNGKCHDFDPYIDKIQAMTNKLVNVLPEYHDC